MNKILLLLIFGYQCFTQAEPIVLVSDTNLTRCSWILDSVSISTLSNAKFPIVSSLPAKIEISFTSGWKASGTDGCNGYSGKYLSRGAWLFIYDLSSTMVWCTYKTKQDEMKAMQKAYFQVVSGSIEYSIINGKLIFSCMDGNFYFIPAGSSKH